MRYAAVALLFLLLDAPAVHAQTPDPPRTEEVKPSPVRGGVVTYTLPESSACTVTGFGNPPGATAP